VTEISQQDIKAQLAAEYERGFNEALARGVATIAEIWTAILEPLSEIRMRFEEIEMIHDCMFNTIEGRAEGAPTLHGIDPAHWDAIAGKWEDIKKRAQRRPDSAIKEPPHPIFRDHSCWRCKDGAEPCVRGGPHLCEYPHARND
jgi:hypothetical protein